MDGQAEIRKRDRSAGMIKSSKKAVAPDYVSGGRLLVENNSEKIKARLSVGEDVIGGFKATADIKQGIFLSLGVS